MAKYRTALGKIVDMSTLVAKNEKTRAVGNMSVNARGDTIDSKGNIIKHATNKVNEAYGKTVGNRAAQPQKAKPRTGDQVSRTPQRPAQPARASGSNQRIEEPVQLTAEELELDRELDDDELTEQIKAMESGLPKAK